MRNSILLPLLACAIASTATLSADEQPTPKDAALLRVAPEVPDQPPGTVVPRDDAGARSPGLRVTRGPYVSVQVNVDALGQNIVGDAANEPSIAVSPTDPGNLVIGWRQFDTIASNFRQAGWAYSFDGGASWTFPGVLEPGVFRSDPVLDSDSAGNIYYQSLESSFDVQVFRSLDGGVTWQPPVDSFGGDKNWMAIDKTGGTSDGHVYGIWQRFAGCCGQSTFTRSIDGGDSYEQPVEVALRPTFGTLTVGPDARVYAVGIDGTFTQDFSQFVIAISRDASDPLTPSTFVGAQVDMGGSMRASAGPNPSGLLGQATVAVDHSPGPDQNTIYMLASVDPPGGDPLDVNFIRSEPVSGGWSAPVRVNDDPVGNGAWQWFGTISTAPNGRIDVIWNDTRASGQSNLSELYYAYSYDTGITWSPNVPVSPQFNSHVGWPNQNKLGDYYQIVSDETGGNVAYAATFNGEQDVYHVRVFPDCNDNGRSDVTDVTVGFSFDCNTNQIPDECDGVVLCTAAGSVPDGDSVDGTPLRVHRGPTGFLSLEWGASCLGGDGDFEIYEGVVGDFTSHDQVVCSTGGATQADVPESAFDAYYLVVPTNGVSEGSYGVDSDGIERPQSTNACRPREIGTCPEP